MLRQAFILSGGLGTRLKEKTKNTPKPMLTVGERPFLEYIIWNLKRHGITTIILSVGYLSEQIIKYFDDGSRFRVTIDYVVEKEPAGTGGALLLAKNKLDDIFFMLNGDTLFDINYLDLALQTVNELSSVGVALRYTENVERYGKVNLEGDKIIDFNEKVGHGYGLINSGVYVFDKKLLAKQHILIPSSLEKDLLPSLAKEGHLKGIVYHGFFIDIGLKHSFLEANISVPHWQKKPTVFLDRDGILNIDYGYVYRPSDFDWVDGAIETIKRFNDIGYLVIVITNQAGIARGYYSEEDFYILNEWMNEELRRVGAHIDAVYYCPHHPTEGYSPYRMECNCRKPAPGLIKQALEEWPIDKNNSVLIGDQEKDMQAAHSAGIKGMLFKGGNLLSFMRQILRRIEE